MKKKESKLPETIRPNDDNGLVVLCESINPVSITKEDIDTFSVTLAGPNNEITNNDSTDNMINANVLSTISASDTMLKATITNPAIGEANARSLINYNSYIQKECLQGIFNNFIVQALNNLCVVVKNTVDNFFTGDEYPPMDYSKMFEYIYSNNIHKARIISKLFAAYCNSTTVEEFNVISVQIATLFSNQLTIDVRNNIYNIICKHSCGHSVVKNLIMNSLENDMILFHDTIVDILFHITDLMVNHYGNVRNYNNYNNYNLDF